MLEFLTHDFVTLDKLDLVNHLSIRS